MDSRQVSGGPAAPVEPLGRAVLAVVVTGVVLGLAFNALAQQQKPARGLAWISQPKEIPESIEKYMNQNQEGETATEPPPEAAPSTAAAKTPENVAPVASKPPAPRPAESPKVAPPPAPPEHATSRSSAVDPDDPMGDPSAAAGEGGEIPDLGRPMSIELATTKSLFDRNGALFIDAREPDEYAAGHIPGSVNLPFDTAGSDPEQLQALDSAGRPYVVYCGGGTCEVSMHLADTLVYQFAKRRVLVYMGGYPEWEGRGYPVQKGKEAGR